MATPSASTNATGPREVLAAAGRHGLALLWHAVRLPILATLLVLEPPVRFVLSAIAVLGITMSLFFEYLVRLPHFPFALMIGVSMASAALLVPYHLLIRFFSIRP
jgi:hypothetical protein